MQSVDDGSLFEKKLKSVHEQMKNLRIQGNVLRNQIKQYQEMQKQPITTYQMYGWSAGTIRHKIAQITAHYNSLCDKHSELKTNIENIKREVLQTRNKDFLSQHQQLLDRHKICVNRYHSKSLEGNQAKKYRLNFKNICSPIFTS